MLSKLVWLVPVLACGVGACFAEFPEDLLPKDGSSNEVSASDGLVVDRSGPTSDTRPWTETGVQPDTQPTPDLPPSASACLADWSNWSCTTSVPACTAVCPGTGTTAFRLTCNKNNCNCSDSDGNNVACAAQPGFTCADCSAAFAAECCNGL
jgi:hypothetical protein